MSIEIGKKIAGRLPKPPSLYYLGYEAAVAEVEAFFVGVVDAIQKYGVWHTRLALGAQARSEAHPGWYKKIARELGEILEELRGLDPEQAARVIGYVRWTYVADMPFWIFQSYPLSAKWDERIAYQAIHYKLIPLEKRGKWVLPVPPGWEEHQLFLSDNAWYHVIKAKSPRAPIPEGWDRFEPEDVVIFPSSSGVPDKDEEDEEENLEYLEDPE